MARAAVLEPGQDHGDAQDCRGRRTAHGNGGDVRHVGVSAGPWREPEERDAMVRYRARRTGVLILSGCIRQRAGPMSCCLRLTRVAVRRADARSRSGIYL